MKANFVNMQLGNLLPSVSNFPVVFAEPDNPALLIQNLAGFPAAVERYKARGMDANVFSKEEPLTTSYQALQPTSGRKQWKLKHNKRIKKPMKADKQGFRGAK